MRLLLAIHNAYTDGNSGAARCVRTLAEWMSDAGHDCRVLCSARFDANPPRSILQHLKERCIVPRTIRAPTAFTRHLRRRNNKASARPMLQYSVAGVPVTQIVTRDHDPRSPSRLEYEQLVFQFDHIFSEFRPDLVLTYGAHPAVQEFLRRARALGAKTLFTIRNHGYENADYFQYADNVLATSPYLSRIYHDKIGLLSAGIPSPIHWGEVLAPENTRAFVTFVNPRPIKGLALFARLADMIGSTRPDIPILVIQSASTAEALNRIRGIDFTRHPQIMAAGATQTPAEYFALTRVLLVPSLFDEPFGRVAAESLINGIPPLVSTRGALAETVGKGGTVLPVPDWLTPDERRLPSEAEVAPWFESVCRLWDDPEHYERQSARAKAAGAGMYAEERQRRLYEAYFRAAVDRPGFVDRAGIDVLGL